jgi:fructosamine-3-kinase
MLNITQAEQLCNLLDLGKIIAKPTKVNGGLLHKMWHVKTANKSYAVKELNPDIMSKNNIKQEYELTEEIARN